MRIKGFLVIITLLFATCLAIGQENIINMVAFEKYLVSLDSATINKDKQRIKELKQLYGDKYDRSKVASRARKTGDKIDREACAYMAAYYEDDAFKKQSIRDLKKAKEYYVKSIDNSDWAETCEVLYRYTMLIFKCINGDAIAEIIDLDSYSPERLLREFGSYLWKSAGYGSYLANYGMAYVYQMKFAPWADASDITTWLFNEDARERLEFCRDFKWVNENVIEHYSQAAKCGNDYFQIELAQYLLNLEWRAVNNSFFLAKFKSSEYLNKAGEVISIEESFRDDLLTQGLYWYRKAADNGNSIAMIDLAVCMLKQISSDTTNIHQSVIGLLENAAERGNTLAMYNLSVIMMNERREVYGWSEYSPYEDRKKGFEWAKRGAETGDYRCQHLLGRYYYFGLGTSINKTEALKWYKEAAAKGSPGANYMSGLLYLELEGIDNKKIAVDYFYNADIVKEAQSKLADCYFNGIGVEFDRLKSREYKEKANNERMESYEHYVPEICYIEIEPAQSFRVSNFSYWGIEPDPSAFLIPSCMWKWKKKIIGEDPLL